MNEDEKKQKLEEIIEAWDSMIVTIKVIKLIGDGIKWMLILGAMIAGAWAALVHSFHKGS